VTFFSNADKIYLSAAKCKTLKHAFYTPAKLAAQYVHAELSIIQTYL